MGREVELSGKVGPIARAPSAVELRIKAEKLSGQGEWKSFPPLGRNFVTSQSRDGDVGGGGGGAFLRAK